MSDWNLGLDPTPATGTDPYEAMNRINFHDHSDIGKGEPINSAYVTNTPAGNITATNTQAAINQLDGIITEVATITTEIVNSFEITGRPQPVGETLSSGNYGTYQIFTVKIPAGKSLVLKQARYYMQGVFKIRVQGAYSPDLKWNSLAHQGEESPNHILYTNSSGSETRDTVSILVVNDSGVTLTLDKIDNWWLKFSIE